MTGRRRKPAWRVRRRPTGAAKKAAAARAAAREKRERLVRRLFSRLTAGHGHARETMLSASHAYWLERDPFWLWCELHAPAALKSEAGPSRYDEARRAAGRAFEDQWIAERHPKVRDLRAHRELGGLRETLEAMARRVPVLRGATLFSVQDGAQGVADLLVRDDSGRSVFGPFAYRVVEIKRAKEVKPHHRVQAGIYNAILGRILGGPPPPVTIAFNGGEATLSHAELAGAHSEAMARWGALRDGKQPEPAGPGATPQPWQAFADRLLEERGDLTLLPGVGPAARERIRRKAKVADLAGLLALGQEAVAKLLGRREGTACFHHAQARKTALPVPRTDGRPQKLPPGHLVYFDVETCDDVGPGMREHIYLFGIFDPRSNRYVSFLARGPEEEAAAFRKLVAYAALRPEIAMGHWSPYEARALARLAERRPELARDVARICSLCFDLLPLVAERWYLPTPGYSIKDVAAFCGFSWRRDAFGALEAMACYWDYVASGRPSDIAPVLAYNEDDCRAMHAVTAASASWPRPEPPPVPETTPAPTAVTVPQLPPARAGGSRGSTNELDR